MKSLKLANISIVSSLILINSMLYSCNIPIENINKNNINILDNNKVAFISASDRKGSSIKFNINSIIKNFSTKATQNGSQEVTTMNSIRIVLSENSIDPFNFPVNLNTSKLYTTPPGIPTSVVFDNLQAGKTYYIAARAYSSSVESTANNITEGGTYITNEYIQVLSNGSISIVGDDLDGEIDFYIPLKNTVGARVDVPISISNGKMGDFKNKDNKVEQVASIPLSIPDVDITDGGNGAIVWRERATGSGIKRIKLKAIIDNIPNGSSIDVDTTAPTTDLLKKPSVSINSNNNGFVCWDYTVNAGVPVIRFKHLNNLTTLSGLNTLTGSDQAGCDIQIKNNSSDSGIIAFTDISAGGVIKARALKSVNNFASFTLGTDLSATDTPVSTSSGFNSNVSISKVTKDNFVLSAWQNDSGGDGFIKIRKVKIDTSTSPPTLNFEAPLTDTTIAFQATVLLINPSVAIDENGNGLIVWHNTGDNRIYARKILNYKAQGSNITLTTGASSNPKVYINDQGHGLITWTQAQDIYGLNIINYELGTTSFKINDLTGSDIQDNSSFDFDSNGNGYIGWEDDRDSPPTSEIYGKRIIDYYPN